MSDRSPTAPLCLLDVRPIVAAGGHPVDEVLRLAGALPDDGVLELLAPFEPRPLLKRLAERGHTVRATPPRDDDGGDAPWTVHVGKRPLPEVLELTGLEPPEPLERLLEASAALAPGATLLAHTPRTPVMLWPELVRLGHTFHCVERPDLTATVWVRR